MPAVEPDIADFVSALGRLADQCQTDESKITLIALAYTVADATDHAAHLVDAFLESVSAALAVRPRRNAVLLRKIP